MALAPSRKPLPCEWQSGLLHKSLLFHQKKSVPVLTGTLFQGLNPVSLKESITRRLRRADYLANARLTSTPYFSLFSNSDIRLVVPLKLENNTLICRKSAAFRFARNLSKTQY